MHFNIFRLKNNSMSIKYFTLSLLCALLFTTSCRRGSNAPEGSKIDNAYKSVMAVHDEVMPEMGTIHRLRKKLKKKVAAGIESETEKDLVISMIKNLDDADEGMMSWMAEFKMPKEGSETEKLNFLASEQTKIDKVNKDMRDAIKGAQNLLGIKEE